MSAVAEKDDQFPVPSNTVSMFERLARDPSVDVGKLEKLMELQERAMAQQAKGAYAIAMADAQAAMRPIAADANNPQTRSKYASYHALDRALRPIYTNNGFALSFDTGTSGAPELVRVMCEVSHIGGHSRSHHIDMPADGKGAKGGDVMTKTHATGAAMTYGMRYLLKMIFNVAVGEDDNDGNEPMERVSADNVATLTALMQEVKADKVKFLKYLKVGRLEDLPARAYPDAVAALNAKRAKP